MNMATKQLSSKTAPLNLLMAKVPTLKDMSKWITKAES